MDSLINWRSRKLIIFFGCVTYKMQSRHPFVLAVLEYPDTVGEFIVSHGQKHNLEGFAIVVDEIRTLFHDTTENLESFKQERKLIREKMRHLETMATRPPQYKQRDSLEHSLEQLNSRLPRLIDAERILNASLEEDLTKRLDKIAHILGSREKAHQFIRGVINGPQLEDHPEVDQLIHAAVEHHERFKHAEKPREIATQHRAIIKRLTDHRKAIKQNDAELAELKELIQEHEGLIRNIDGEIKEISMTVENLNRARAASHRLSTEIENGEAMLNQKLNELATVAAQTLGYPHKDHPKFLRLINLHLVVGTKLPALR